VTLDVPIVALIGMVGTASAAVIGAAVVVVSKAFEVGRYMRGQEMRVEHLEKRVEHVEAQLERHHAWHETARVEREGATAE